MSERATPAREPETGSIGHRAASGVLWLTVQKWAIRISGFISIAVLTRLLSPEDFGTVAAATTVLPFFYLLSDLGFAAYIVQADTVDRRLLSTGFWFSLIAGLGLAVVVIAAAPLFGLVFQSAEFVPVLQVLALSVIFNAVAAVPMALLRRDMRFRALAAQGGIAAVAAQVVAIVMSIAGAGVWALVGQTLTSVLLTAVLAWAAARWRPSFAFSRRDFSSMARFGGNVLAVESVALGRAWAEAAIISSALGMAALGYLSIAQRLVQIVQDLTGAALVPVSTVTFAKVRGDSERLRSAYVRALRVTYAVMSPPLLLLAVAAPLIIPIVFGDGWEESWGLTRILALASILVVGANLDNGLFYGLGRPGRWFAYALVVDVCTVAATAVTAHWGLQAVAYGFLVVAALATIGRLFLVARLLRTNAGSLAGPLGFLTAAVVGAGVAGWLVLSVTADLAPILRIVLVGLAVLAAYLVVIRLLARQVIDEMTGYLGRFAWTDRFRTLVLRKERS
ncbi:lipopolysaccharide biosynthesis protein [Agromyces sp. NPDC058136]|uniref:lipopolysaccharide biosynthesis protein n=1 Tax=Agromyces sp. NPDC058136 TaxID=3346354 RepID=UPI0036DBEB37